MNKQEIYAMLREKGIPHGITEHRAIDSMQEIPDMAIPHSEDIAKNLFVRDDKGQNYCLITVRGDKRVDLKEFRNAHGTRRLSFASAQELMAKLGLTPGSVTPLGLLHDAERAVTLYLDREFLAVSGRVGVHPNENTATVWLKPEDLIALLEEHGSKVCLIDI